VSQKFTVIAFILGTLEEPRFVHAKGVYFYFPFLTPTRDLDSGKFFIFMAFMILCSLAATSMALAVSAICRTTDLSVTVLPMLLEVKSI
jgi:hypothetical protein